MSTFDPDTLTTRQEELEAAMGAPGFWDDQQKAARISTEHARVSLSRVKVPVMLVAATYDVLAGARDMRTAHDRLEDSTYVELRASHFVQMEKPDVVHDLLLGFLDEVADS